MQHYIVKQDIVQDAIILSMIEIYSNVSFSLIKLMFLCSILLFNDGRLLKYCDFGTAKKLESTLSNTNAVGTIRYMAPEVIRGMYVHGLSNAELVLLYLQLFNINEM